MELAISGVALPFEVTYDGADPALVAMSVYNVTTGTPVLVQGPTVMVRNGLTNTYVGFFTAANLRAYTIIKAVYTDNTFTTFDPGFSQGSESIFVNDSGGGGSSSGGCQLVGVIQKTPVLIGVIEC